MDERSRLVEFEVQERVLQVIWGDGHRSRFHHVWLRDACRCRDCGEPSFGDKRVVLSALPEDLRPRSAHIGNDDTLVVTWAHDGHLSAFEPAWLRAHCYSRAERERRQFRPTLWHAQASPDLTPFALPALAASESVLYRMLEGLHSFGVVLVGEVPAEAGVQQVADLVGYLRETNYGRVYDIKVEPVARTFADLPASAPLHTDDAFRVFPPGYTMLHAVQPSTDGGGASVFLDGFDVVRRLREESPEAVSTLARLPLRFSRAHPGEHDFRLQARMIRLDADGETAAVRFGLHNIAPPDIDPNQVEPFYAALKRLDRLIRDPALRVGRRLEAGELALVDNERVLHGREAFDGRGGRHIRGGFVDRDAVYSRWRVLAERLGRPQDRWLRFPGESAS